MGRLGPLGVEFPEKDLVIGIHAIRATDAIFDCGGKADVGLGLCEKFRV